MWWMQGPAWLALLVATDVCTLLCTSPGLKDVGGVDGRRGQYPAEPASSKCAKIPWDPCPRFRSPLCSYWFLPRVVVSQSPVVERGVAADADNGTLPSLFDVPRQAEKRSDADYRSPRKCSVSLSVDNSSTFVLAADGSSKRFSQGSIFVISAPSAAMARMTASGRVASLSAPRCLPSRASARRYASAATATASRTAAAGTLADQNASKESGRWKGTDTLGGSTKLFIGGQFVESRADRWIDVNDPVGDSTLDRRLVNLCGRIGACSPRKMS